MFGGLKDYAVKCHVCLREFVVQSEFLSGTSWQPERGGPEFVMGTCNMDKTCKRPHSRDEIRASWARTMGEDPLPAPWAV